MRALWIMIGLLLFVTTIMLEQSSNKKITLMTTPQESLVTTWGWATIISKPISLITTNRSDDLRLMQVGFKVGDGSINTALMVSSEFLNMKSSPIPKWKIGDEILIASVPGSIINNFPSPSYIVIDYRPQEQKK